jgi:hypothetical protein
LAQRLLSLVLQKSSHYDLLFFFLRATRGKKQEQMATKAKVLTAGAPAKVPTATKVPTTAKAPTTKAPTTTARTKVQTVKKAAQVGAVSVVTAMVVVAIATFVSVFFLDSKKTDAIMRKLPKLVQEILFWNMAVVAIGAAALLLVGIIASAGSSALLV